MKFLSMNVLYFAKIEPLGNPLIVWPQTATYLNLRGCGGTEIHFSGQKTYRLRFAVPQVLLILSKKGWDEKGGEQNTHY